MQIEFYFRTYRSFGTNATLHLAASWLESRLRPSYGGTISSVLVEMCCNNTSPPRKTLERLDSDFQDWLSTLPYYELREGGSELRLCYNAVRYSHDEVERETQILALKTFQNIITKTAQLVLLAKENLRDLNEFDANLLADDLRKAREAAPKGLDQLVKLYEEFTDHRDA